MTHGDGTFPSITFHKGALWMIYQNVQTKPDGSVESFLRVLVDGVLRATIPTSASAAFPVIASDGSTIYAAWRDDAPCRLLNLETGEARDVVMQADGNHPILLSQGRVYYQHVGMVWSQSYTSRFPRAERAETRGTGIVRIDINGRPVFWDEDRLMVPGATCPMFAGGYAAAQHPDGGVLVRELNTGKETVLWPGTDTFEPVIAVDGDRIAVATWGNQSVRSDVIATSVLRLPEPTTNPIPTPTPEPKPEPIPMPIPDQTAVIARVRADYPTPLGARHGAFLLAAAQAVGQGAGLLRKDSGTNIELPDGVRVSQDIIVLPNGDGYDCLGSGETTATPQWSGPVEGSPFPASRFYAVSGAQPGPIPGPIPGPAPVPGATLDTLVRGLIAAAVAPLVARIAALEAKPPPGPGPTLSTITLKSVHGYYLAAEPDGTIVADRDAAGEWERWSVEGQ